MKNFNIRINIPKPTLEIAKKINNKKLNVTRVVNNLSTNQILTSSNLLQSKNFQQINKPFLQDKNFLNQISAYSSSVKNISTVTQSPIIKALNDVAKIKNHLFNIDFEVIEEAQRNLCEEIYDSITEHIKNMWCLDIDIVDDLGINDLDNSSIYTYVEKYLEENIEELLNDPIYDLHHDLIEEAFMAYENGFYKVTVMCLYAPLDHILSKWAEGSITPQKIEIKGKVKYQKRNKRTKQKLTNLVENEAGRWELGKVFATPVFHFYIEAFRNIKNSLHKDLNRNALLHGYYDYSSIGKEEALKLFQVLKAATIVKEIPFNKFEKD